MLLRIGNILAVFATDCRIYKDLFGVPRFVEFVVGYVLNDSTGFLLINQLDSFPYEFFRVGGKYL
jgi:hypothetical protein